MTKIFVNIIVFICAICVQSTYCSDLGEWALEGQSEQIFCRDYINKIAARIDILAEDRANRINQILRDKKFVELSLNDPLTGPLFKRATQFTASSHDTSVDLSGKKPCQIPVCSNCMKQTFYEAGSPVHMSLVSGRPNTGFHMSNTTKSAASGGFGQITFLTTPPYEDVYQLIQDLAQSGREIQFLEIASGFNLKSLAVWLMGKGKVTCTVNDISDEHAESYLRHYLLLSVDEIVEAHKQSPINLNISDFLSGDLSSQRKTYDVIVMNNLLHYLTQEQVAKAFSELRELTDVGSYVYLSAFSGTLENHHFLADGKQDIFRAFSQDTPHIINRYLRPISKTNDSNEPIYLSDAKVEIAANTQFILNQYENHPDLEKIKQIRYRVPNIINTAQTFAFFPLPALKKLAEDNGFVVEASGVFAKTTTQQNTIISSGPPFSWVKMKRV